MDDFEAIDNAEIIDHLRAKGFGKLVEIFLAHEGRIHKRNGSLNKSALARLLGLPVHKAQDLLEQARLEFQPEES